MSQDLLGLLTDVLDVRDVFPRVSEIVAAAVPHDRLVLWLFQDKVTHERGAFTGAQQSKAGQIELAANGVLFLDEVTELSQSAQAKLLRVLQEREFQRLGGTRTIKANVRVIAATNRDLRKAVEQGTFREDLYYRLQVFEIAIPPLRDRRSDVLPLADAFLQDIARSFGRPLAGLTAAAKRALIEYSWPGNARELRNALERAAILCEGGLIAPQHLLVPVERHVARVETTDLKEFERQTIEQMMHATHGNKSRAAKRLGLSRTELYSRLRKYRSRSNRFLTALCPPLQHLTQSAWIRAPPRVAQRANARRHRP